MAWHSIKWVVPLALASAVTMEATEASACSPDPCSGSDRFYWFDATHADVATDGVLVFQAYRGDGGMLSDEEALDYITLEVTDEDGAAVAGQLEAVGELGLVVFRPDEPLAAEAILTATATIDNESIDDTAECGLEDPVPTEFTVGSGALPELALPDIEITQAYELQPTPTLDNLVCCDGAYPQEQLEMCFDGLEILWSEGHCAAQEGIGWVRAELPVPEDLDPALAGNMLLRLVGSDGTSVALGGSDGALAQSSTEPFEAYFEVVDLARQETLASEPLMLGEDLAQQLGEQSIDVTADLEASCESEAYVCTAQPDGDTAAWDPEDCAAWPDDGGTDSDTDGGTDSDTDGGSDSDTDGGSDSDTDGGSDSDTDGGSDSDGGSDGTAGLDDDSGCACTADAKHGRGTALLSMLALLGLVGVRRRR